MEFGTQFLHHLKYNANPFCIIYIWNYKWWIVYVISLNICNPVNICGMNNALPVRCLFGARAVGGEALLQWELYCNIFEFLKCFPLEEAMELTSPGEKTSFSLSHRLQLRLLTIRTPLIIQTITIRTNARFRPNSRGTWYWLTTKKNGQTRDYSEVGRQGRMFLLCYSSEGHKLLLDTRNKSGLLAIEIDKLHDRFKRQKR